MNLKHLFGLVCLVGFAWAADAPPENLTVSKGDFNSTLTFTGELRAVERMTISGPRAWRTRDLVITYLAPEGSQVKAGDVLVEFDTTELEARRLELEQSLEDARVTIAQTKADIESQRQDLLLSLAQNGKDLKVAQLYIGIDPELIPAADAEQYKYDYDTAGVNVEKAKEKLDTLAKTEKAQLQVVQLDFEQANLDMQRIQAAIDKLTIRATSPGLVVYADNRTRAGKVQVGDSVFAGSPVINLPNMSKMEVDAYVYDADFPLLKGGEQAEVILDAVPDRVFKGHVESISESAQPRDFRTQLKAFVAKVLLDDPDTSVMKPGMTARVRIPFVRKDVTLIPRAAIQLAPDGSAFVLPVGSNARVPVELIDAGETEAAVKGDLTPGQQLQQSPTTVRGVAASKTTEWIKVDRDDFRFFVAGSGTVEAEREASIGPPTVSRGHGWRFRIISLTPEGSEVEPGDPLVAFDPTETLNELRDERASLQTVREEVDKKKASEQITLKDLELQLEQAKVQDEKAKNKLIEAREFESNLEVKKAEYEAEFAGTQVQLLQKKLDFVKESSRLQFQLLDDQIGLHEARIKRDETALEQLSVKAPIGGVVIYATNWRNEKKEVGSDVFRMEQVLSIPDLDTLRVQGQVAEVDAGRVKIGQSVSVTLDAVPDHTYQGHIKEIGTIFRRASFDKPLKVLDVKVALDEPDPQVMRPGMVAKLEIISHEFKDVLAVPLSAVKVEEGQSYVWVRKGEKTEKRAVQLGEDNGLVAVVKQGLDAGEEVAARPPGVNL
ncbi:MAG: efflux RND transporter periplasmic adaptor subunit [Acidobacteriota bacterium]